jgi:hypothetical protein
VRPGGEIRVRPDLDGAGIEEAGARVAAFEIETPKCPSIGMERDMLRAVMI